MKIPSLQTFILQEDLNQTLLNDIYVMASAPSASEEYGSRLQKITTEDILRRFQQEAWPEILDILSHEFLHILATDEFQYMDAAGKSYGTEDSDMDDIARLEQVLGVNGVKQLRSLSQQLSYLLEDSQQQNFAAIQKIFKQHHANFTLPVMISAFEHLSWEPDYGGKAWAEITQAALKIGEALNQKTFSLFYKALDHFVDLAHNTNTVLDKFKGYDERWLFYWVDLKRYSKSVYDLNPTSKTVKEYLKSVRGDIPQVVRTKTNPQHNLYEVLLRGKQFTQTLTDADWNFSITYLTDPARYKHIEVIQILKRNGIPTPVFLQTTKQILTNVKNGAEKLIEIQERRNVSMLKYFMADWHHIFDALQYAGNQPQKIYTALISMALPAKEPSNENNQVANLQVIKHYAQLTNITLPKLT